jgi:hypothetical protein
MELFKGGLGSYFVGVFTIDLVGYKITCNFMTGKRMKRGNLDAK